jgi:hypothetical protein
MSGPAWTWADVPKLSVPGITRHRPNGRPKHAVTLGYHDVIIRRMMRNGATAPLIARELDCSRVTAEMRMNALRQGADVPKMPARRRPGGGRPLHPVTLGHHDDMIVPRTLRGESAVYIASWLDCGESVVAKRLRVLGVIRVL